MLTACHKDEPTRRGTARRTVVVYMMAENSLRSFSTSDISEMIGGKDSIPLDANLVVYIDDTLAPRIMTIDAMSGRTVCHTLPEENSCDSTVFLRNLQQIVGEFPAHSYGLIMWSHGSGWVPKAKEKRKSIGVDNMMNNQLNHGDELNISAMRWALEQLGIQWEYIFFDACFMQGIEVDYELKDVCRYIVASPAEIPGDGAPYDRIMPHLFADTLSAHKIANTYFEHYKSGIGLLISVADCGKMRHLLDVTQRLCPDYYQRSVATSDLQAYAPWHSYTGWKPEYFDLGSTFATLLSASDYAEWRQAWAEAYPVSLHTDYWMSIYNYQFMPIIIDADHYAGATVFIPNPKYADMGYNESIRQTLWYKDYTSQ